MNILDAVAAPGYFAMQNGMNSTNTRKETQTHKKIPLNTLEDLRKETEDAEANLFASELLVPESFLRQAVKDMGGLDLADDSQVKKLANVFQVPISIMSYRLHEIFCTDS